MAVDAGRVQRRQPAGVREEQDDVVRARRGLRGAARKRPPAREQVTAADQHESSTLEPHLDGELDDARPTEHPS